MALNNAGTLRHGMSLKRHADFRQGAYFITLCAHRRKSIFGFIENGNMRLSEFGKAAFREWARIAGRYFNVNADIFQIMPNHIHGIIILGAISEIRETARVAPTASRNIGALARNAGNTAAAGAIADFPTIDKIINSYKLNVFEKCSGISVSQGKILRRLWRPGYEEHVIRSEYDFVRISDNIANNPRYWKRDEMYGG